MGELDMTQLLEDLIYHYVKEVPELNAALPLLDTYCEVLKRCMAEVTEQSSGEFLEDSVDSQSSVFYSVTGIFRRYGLDIYADRQLDPIFCTKYPLFDVERSKPHTMFTHLFDGHANEYCGSGGKITRTFLRRCN
jgi:hypothetical protein